MVILIGLALTQHTGKAMGAGRQDPCPVPREKLGAPMSGAGLGTLWQGQSTSALQG